MKKLMPLLLIAGCITTAISCTKDVITSKKELAKNDAGVNSASSVSSDNLLVAQSPHFGVSISSVVENDKIMVANKLGVKYVRTGITLVDFKGKNQMVDMYLANGFKVILNLNYDDPTDGPVPFPTNLVAYRKLLESVLDKYKPEVAVIENEPTNRNYHSGPIDNYIKMLKVAIDVCKARNIKVADGCVHVKFIDQIMKGEKLNEPGTDAQKLIIAYKSLDLDYVNVHTKGEGDAYTSGLLKSAADYLRKQTGKPIMSNEFSIHDNSSDLVRNMVQGWKDGGYVYAIAFSGNSDPGPAL